MLQKLQKFVSIVFLFSCIFTSTFAAALPDNPFTLNGTNQYASIPYNSALEFTTGTIEMWVRPDWSPGTVSTNLCLISERENSTRYSFHINKNLDGIGLFNNINYAVIPYQFTQGQWYHIAFVMTNVSTEIFINGVSIGLTGNTINTGISGLPIKIGISQVTGNFAGNEFFKGSIDEVRIWNTSRTQNQIQTNRSNSIAANSAGLIGYYPVDAGVTTESNRATRILKDYTANNFNGTLFNYWAAAVITDNASSVTISSATVGGNVTDGGGNAVTDRGIVYSTTNNMPTVTDTKLAIGNGTGAFSAALTGLTAATTYYLRAYATTATGTSYGAANQFTTAKNPQIITFNSIPTKTYGDAGFDAGATSSSGLGVIYTSSNSTVATIVNNQIHIVGAGSANITALQVGDNNYDAAAPVTQNLTVNKALLTITATDQTKTYGTANPNLTAGYTGFVNGETSANLTIQPTITTPATTTSAVGAYPIIVSGAAAANYQISYVNGSLSVYPGIQIITFTAAPKTYGDADFSVNAIASSGLPITYSSSNPAIATVDVNGTVHIVAAGNVIISAVQPGNGNYVATTRINQQITIYKALLNITANNQNKYVGDPNPALTVNYDGFVNGDTPANLTAQPVTNTTATISSPVGTYPVAVSNAASSNYNFTYVNGVLTVEQITQILNFAAFDTKTYGDADFAVNATASSGLPIDYISSDPTVATVSSSGMVHILSAGITTITASQLGDNRYTATADITQNLTVNKAPLTLTAANQTVSYGSAIPALTFNSTGFVNGEDQQVLNTQPTLTTTATSTSDAGTYPIAIADADAGNYNITYLPGTLTISPAVQTVTLTSPATKIYGDADFNLNASSNTTLPLNYASSNTALATVDASGNVHILGAGTVTFTVSQDGNSNYATANAAQQTITINKAPLTITADNQTRAYGASNPTLNVNYTGFVNAETAVVLTIPVTVSTSAVVNSPAGNYPITASDAAAANYAIAYSPGTLTINNPIISGVSFVQIPIFENQSAGILAGTLSAQSLDPNAVFTYAFSSRPGSADNNSFIIQGDKILTAKSLNYEQQSSYSVLVRATNQYGLYFDQAFTLQINDVNEAPTLAVIPDQLVCNLPSAQKINLTGITPGPESAQNTTLSVTSSNPSLFNNLSASNVSGGTAALNYTLTGLGSATITVTVKDNGGTANGGTDSFSQTFTLTANAVPVAAISSDKGTATTKGQTVTLTATGGSTYNWAEASGIVGATNNAVLQVRPAQNTTYTVTATNASGCSTTASITINVTDDYESIQANNILTPNGDGKNDTWVVKNIDLYPESTLIIFDKAGRRLLNVKHYDNSWDGSFQGSPLAEGTYYYVIDFGGGKPPMKGFITLLRNR